ncbi:type III-A CRISPR-associated protein Cas10/Csm1 [Methanothermobacter thermautotrophicus]|uniref:type III-A CRISPR-associated protein Cas10/Csm1 n=1 Tax=Methanothermobacter thermautotrophicus TaxID=145262 RepID=UPI0022B950C4|nr:type III-A CRISPR-associated protein Cas10/Csm1 [Methanothermobacter thermautotrophicus]WBF07429.1 type III-A CRISPR-associated protein Cas10/Csm1 [Methanothermobacter thermautotrophicus]
MRLEDIQLAALLHDIGKFYQRTSLSHSDRYKGLTESDFGKSGAHGKWSATFVIENGLGEDIEDLVLHHHNPSGSRNPEYARIIRDADHHSARERKKSESKQEVKEHPMISVFSQVRLPEREKTEGEYYLPLRELIPRDLKGIKPDRRKKAVMSGWNLEEEYRRLWKLFTSEMSELKNVDVNTVHHLLRKYTSLIPSAVYVSVPDISLFDHLKTTAALAGCLYLHRKEGNGGKPYLIVTGDLSGIQNFITGVASPEEAQKGMSKRLRGRSLYISLLMDAVANRIVSEAGLSQPNILFCGGGNFTLILPNTQEVKDILERVSREVNLGFIESFNAELYLALSYTEAEGDELEDFGDIMDRLARKNLRNKRSKFRGLLDEFFTAEEEPPLGTCAVCGLPSSSSICSSCRSHEELGARVANADYMIRVHGSMDSDFNEAGISYFFETENSVIQRLHDLADYDGRIELLRLNSTDFLEIRDRVQAENLSFGFALMGNTVPAEAADKRALDFTEISSLSIGTGKLAALKMDVDNLGQIFSQGLEKRSISRISTMSSFMDLFFLGYINQVASEFFFIMEPCGECREGLIAIRSEIGTVYRPSGITRNELCDGCREKSTPTIYITYSGGDDVLVFGPYDDIVEFAGKLRNEFREWTCENPSIEISAGIFMGGHKFPAGKAAELAEKQLKRSKELGRGKISVFGETVQWDTDGFIGFNELLEFGMKLEELHTEGKLSKNFIYSLLKLHDSSFHEDVRDFDEWVESQEMRLRIKDYVPYYVYKLRNVSDRELRRELFNEGIRFIPWIRIPVSWVSLRTRNGDIHE